MSVGDGHSPVTKVVLVLAGSSGDLAVVPQISTIQACSCDGTSALAGISQSLNVAAQRWERSAEKAENIGVPQGPELAQRCVRFTRPELRCGMEWYRGVLETTRLLRRTGCWMALAGFFFAAPEWDRRRLRSVCEGWQTPAQLLCGPKLRDTSKVWSLLVRTGARLAVLSGAVVGAGVSRVAADSFAEEGAWLH